MLLELPQDLLICMLSEWLVVGLKDLSVLDVAVGSSRLRTGHWLPLLADLPKLDECRLPIAIRPSLAWMHDRKLQVSRIVVEMAAVNSLDNVSLPYTFAGTSAVAFAQNNFSSSPFGLKECLMLFPNATTIDFSECPVVDHQLLEFLDLPSTQIRELELDNCEDITPAAVAAVGKHFSSTLESLSCDVLDDDAISKLARCCKQLVVIDWSLDAVESEHSLLGFFSQNSKLTTVKLQSYRHLANDIVTNSFVTSISLSCPQLQVLWLDRDDPVDYYVLPVLIANCKQLENVEVREARLLLRKTANGDRHCNIRGINSDPRAADSSIDVLTVLTLPIHEFRWMESDDEDEDEDIKYLPVNRQALYLLVNRNGSTLEDIRIELTDDVEPGDLQYLLTSCPHLTTLKLHAIDNTTTLDDEAVRRLPSQCPKLVALELNCCASDVSTQAVIDMMVDSETTA